MGFPATLSQFSHITEYNHPAFHFHIPEIFYSSSHTGRVGIISIHQELIIIRLHELGTIVFRFVCCQCPVNRIHLDPERTSYRCCSQHILHIIGTYQSGLHLLPFASGRPPTELQERSAFKHLSFHTQDLVTWTSVTNLV